MTLKVIGSSSKGNCYILDGMTEALIIECGCPLKDIKKAIDWNIGKVVGAVVTHQHNDHSGYVKEVAAAGIRVLALQEVIEAKGLIGNPFATQITSQKGYKLGNFLIQPFEVYHDVPCVGYIIQHPEMGKLLFVTDTAAMGYKIDKLNHIMIEANYADDIVDRNVDKGYLEAALRNRVFESHLEIETTKSILQRQDLSNVHNIILIHLSEGNSNAKRFVNEVQSVTGCKTCVAKKGLTVELSSTPY